MVQTSVCWEPGGVAAGYRPQQIHLGEGDLWVLFLGPTKGVSSIRALQ